MAIGPAGSVRSRSERETVEVGLSTGMRLQPGDVVLVTGPIGCGKTVFARGVAAALGVTEPVTSPTYTIVNEYAGRLPFYHVDLYRIASEREFVMLGLDELLCGQGVSLIEWPEHAGSALPNGARKIAITIQPDGSREIREEPDDGA